MRSNYQGFTVIEMVVVAILLVILLAGALPRLLGANQNANALHVSQVQADLRSGMSFYHAQWIADGQPRSGSPLTQFGGLRTNAFGYPASMVNDPEGVGSVSSSADCQAVFANVLHNGPSVSAADNVKAVADSKSDWTAVAIKSDCRFYFTGSGSDTFPTVVYDSTRGLVARVADTTL